MKSFLFIALFASISICTVAQIDNNKMIIGKVDSIYSKILGERRKIMVYSPAMHLGNIDSASRYPVVYLLDGDAHFESVVGMIRQLSEINGNTNCPPMIVVAILNTDRTRDLTPTHIASDMPMMDSSSSKNSGGGENFVAFIEKELMPYIDSVYPSRSYRTLIGHSFGGLTVMSILASHTRLFNAYIAIDPSMWYDNERFLKATEKKLSKNNYTGIKLYLGIANTKPDGMSIKEMLKDTSATTRHIRSIFELDKYIRVNKPVGLEYAGKYYADDDHGSVPMISAYDGLRFIFNYYKLKYSMEDFTDSSTALVKKYRTHYENISQELGYKVSPPEILINGFGEEALRKKYFRRAESLFRMNIENYPNSGNAFDSYANYFEAHKDTNNAITYYQKAFAITRSLETNQKLNALLGKEIFQLAKEELQKYSGEYYFESVSVAASVRAKEGALWISSPGQGDFELTPLGPDTFGIKNVKGFELHFEMNGDIPTGLTSRQPNGTFKAIFKR
jgi:predicted alpha/beta superfamily hydrolase